MKTSILKPGIMIALKSTVTGGVSYARSKLDLSPDEQAKALLEGAALDRWETLKRVADPEEHTKATKARGKALHVIRRTCAVTAFGLLCPEDKESALDEAITEARKAVDEHNAQATHTRIVLYVLKGRIAKDDAEASAAVGYEIETGLDAMLDGIESRSVDGIREACDRVADILPMLTADHYKLANNAVVTARRVARLIVAEKLTEDDATRAMSDIHSDRLGFLAEEDVENAA